MVCSHTWPSWHGPAVEVGIPATIIITAVRWHFASISRAITTSYFVAKQTIAVIFDKSFTFISVHSSFPDI